MFQKLKISIIALASTLLFAAPLAVSGVASAVDPTVTQTDINNSLCNGSNVNFGADSADPGDNCNTDASGSANTLVKQIINILSLVVGAVAVIMLIYGGFRYITSGGKQESVTSAKNTIIYALVGLVIVALAQLVVHFVLTNVGKATS